MCGRYSTLTEDEIIEVRSIIQSLSLRLTRDDLEDYEARPGEIRPTDKAPVITRGHDGIAFESAKFGFKKWDGKGVIINARSETIKTTRTFSGLLDARRCVVPAKEFYEWKVQAVDDEVAFKKKPKKTKCFVKDTEGNLLFFAGLYRDGDDGREFVVITKEPCGEVVNLHDRMPVILRVNQIEAWLSGELSPDDIVRMEFNASVHPCEEPEGMRDGDNDSEQMSLF
jgi:putative SOS response-associated peptidase YedK